MTIKDKQIKNKMLSMYESFLDNSACLNTTELVQVVSDYFGDNPEDGSEIPELYFNIAVEVQYELHKKNLINI